MHVPIAPNARTPGASVGSEVLAASKAHDIRRLCAQMQMGKMMSCDMHIKLGCVAHDDPMRKHLSRGSLASFRGEVESS